MGTDNQDSVDGEDDEIFTSNMDPLDPEQASLPDSSSIHISQLLPPPDRTATPPAVTIHSQNIVRLNRKQKINLSNKKQTSNLKTITT